MTTLKHVERLGLTPDQKAKVITLISAGYACGAATAVGQMITGTSILSIADTIGDSTAIYITDYVLPDEIEELNNDIRKTI